MQDISKNSSLSSNSRCEQSSESFAAKAFSKNWGPAVEILKHEAEKIEVSISFSPHHNVVVYGKVSYVDAKGKFVSSEPFQGTLIIKPGVYQSSVMARFMSTSYSTDVYGVVAVKKLP